MPFCLPAPCPFSFSLFLHSLTFSGSFFFPFSLIIFFLSLTVLYCGEEMHSRSSQPLQQLLQKPVWPTLLWSVSISFPSQHRLPLCCCMLSKQIPVWPVSISVSVSVSSLPQQRLPLWACALSGPQNLCGSLALASHLSTGYVHAAVWASGCKKGA